MDGNFDNVATKTGLAPRDYTVQVKDSRGCTATSKIVKVAAVDGITSILDYLCTVINFFL